MASTECDDSGKEPSEDQDESGAVNYTKNIGASDSSTTLEQKNPAQTKVPSQEKCSVENQNENVASTKQTKLDEDQKEKSSTETTYLPNERASGQQADTTSMTEKSKSSMQTDVANDDQFQMPGMSCTHDKSNADKGPGIAESSEPNKNKNQQIDGQKAFLSVAETSDTKTGSQGTYTQPEKTELDLQKTGEMQQRIKKKIPAATIDNIRHQDQGADKQTKFFGQKTDGNQQNDEGSTPESTCELSHDIGDNHEVIKAPNSAQAVVQERVENQQYDKGSTPKSTCKLSHDIGDNHEVIKAPNCAQSVVQKRVVNQQNDKGSTPVSTSEVSLHSFSDEQKSEQKEKYYWSKSGCITVEQPENYTGKSKIVTDDQQETNLQGSKPDTRTESSQPNNFEANDIIDYQELQGSKLDSPTEFKKPKIGGTFKSKDTANGQQFKEHQRSKPDTNIKLHDDVNIVNTPEDEQTTKLHEDQKGVILDKSKQQESVKKIKFSIRQIVENFPVLKDNKKEQEQLILELGHLGQVGVFCRQKVTGTSFEGKTSDDGKQASTVIQPLQTDNAAVKPKVMNQMETLDPSIPDRIQKEVHASSNAKFEFCNKFEIPKLKKRYAVSVGVKSPRTWIVTGMKENIEQFDRKIRAVMDSLISILKDVDESNVMSLNQSRKENIESRHLCSLQIYMKRRMPGNKLKGWRHESGKFVCLASADPTDTDHTKVTIQTFNTIGLGCSDPNEFCLSVPKWKDGKEKEKSIVRENVQTLMSKAGDQVLSIPLDVNSKTGWRESKFMKTIVNIFLDCDEQTSVVFVHPVQDKCRELLDELSKVFAGFELIKQEGNSSGIESMKKKKKLRISVVKGSLTQQKSDIIVNSTNEKLNLREGYTSGSILRAAGDQIQKECQYRYPDGIRYDQIAETRGYRLCTAVLHCVMLDYDYTSTPINHLKKVVNTCLVRANSQKAKSIAFPALGTGARKHPCNEVAKVMFEQTEKFNSSMHPSDISLEDVMFVIFENDSEAIKAFEEEEKKSKMQKLSKLENAASSHIDDQKLQDQPMILITGRSDVEIKNCSDELFSCDIPKKMRYREPLQQSTSTDKRSGFPDADAEKLLQRLKHDDIRLETLPTQIFNNVRATLSIKMVRIFNNMKSPEQKIKENSGVHVIRKDNLIYLEGNILEMQMAYKYLCQVVRESKEKHGNEGSSPGTDMSKQAADRQSIADGSQSVSSDCRSAAQGSIYPVKSYVTTTCTVNNDPGTMANSLRVSGESNSVRSSGKDPRVIQDSSPIVTDDSNLPSAHSNPHSKEFNSNHSSYRKDAEMRNHCPWESKPEDQTTRKGNRGNPGTNVYLVSVPEEQYEVMKQLNLISFLQSNIKQLGHNVSVPMNVIQYHEYLHAKKKFDSLYTCDFDAEEHGNIASLKSKYAGKVVIKDEHFPKLRMYGRDRRTIDQVIEDLRTSSSNNSNGKLRSKVKSDMEDFKLTVVYQSNTSTVYAINDNLQEAEVDAICIPCCDRGWGSKSSSRIINKAGDDVIENYKAKQKGTPLLKAGDCIITDSGHLKCKYIIHAFVPKWDDYTGKPCLTEDFETDLRKTLMACFYKAIGKGLTSVALPIFSGTGKVDPILLCCNVYRRSVQKIIQDTHTIRTMCLKTIHIVDLNLIKVQLIKEVFQSVIPWTLAEKSAQHFYLLGPLAVHVSCGSILDVQTEAIAVGHDSGYSFSGHVAKRIVKFDSDGQHQKEVKKKGDTLRVKLSPTDLPVKHIFNIQMPNWNNGKFEENCSSLKVNFNKLLNEAAEKVESIAFPFFGGEIKDKDHKRKVYQDMAEAITSYIKHKHSKLKSIWVVNDDPRDVNIMIGLIEEYVYYKVTPKAKEYFRIYIN